MTDAAEPDHDDDLGDNPARSAGRPAHGVSVWSYPGYYRRDLYLYVSTDELTRIVSDDVIHPTMLGSDGTAVVLLTRDPHITAERIELHGRRGRYSGLTADQAAVRIVVRTIKDEARAWAAWTRTALAAHEVHRIKRESGGGWKDWRVIARPILLTDCRLPSVLDR